MYRTLVSAGGLGWASVSVIAQQDLASCVKESSTVGETHAYPHITTLWDHCPLLHEIDFFYASESGKHGGDSAGQPPLLSSNRKITLWLVKPPIE